MSAITRILLKIQTANTIGAATDGGVFLGIGGREFKINTSINDFEQNLSQDIVMGDINVNPPALPVYNPGDNDPRIGYAIDSSDISQSPIYIRFEPKTNEDNWHIKSLFVQVIGSEGYSLSATPGTGFDHLWLGYKFGKIIYFTRRVTLL
jgi:hypothetical protein